MPNCFQLISKDSGETAVFTKVDEEMCQHFGVAPDPVHWYQGWYDLIGFLVATGRDFDQVRRFCREKGWSEYLPIIDYLDERYTTNSWYEVKS